MWTLVPAGYQGNNRHQLAIAVYILVTVDGIAAIKVQPDKGIEQHFLRLADELAKVEYPAPVMLRAARLATMLRVIRIGFDCYLS